nr:spore germination lipoprotein GerD [Paenibacillus nasutitermitis]
MAFIAALTMLLTSCGSEPSSGGNQMLSYKDMKSMVIDILKTEDAQKALQESSSSGGSMGSSSTSKLLSIQDQEQVKLAVKDTLVSPEYNKVIEKLMLDTRFAGEFATAVNKQNKQIHKDLLKDPTYQKDLMKVMKDPEMEKMYLEIMQSSQYRSQVMTIMQESMSSPIIRMEILDLLKKAVKEELKPSSNEKQKSGSDKGKDQGEGSQQESSDMGGQSEG